MRRRTHTDAKRRNRPIVSLIKWYADKQSCRVSDARQEIQRRFEGLDWRHQKQIMSLFLDGCATDRRWALKQLYTHWDASFEQQIAQLWGQEKSHEYICTVNRRMPMDFVLKHLDWLGSERNYFYICQRFAGCEGFTVERDKLMALDYLRLIYYNQFKTLDDDEALDILFEVTRECCIFWTTYETKHREVEDFVTPIQFKPVDTALYYLRSLNFYRVIKAFGDWNARVKAAIEMSDEHKFVSRYIHCDEEKIGCTEHDFHIAFKYAYIHLDDKYKQSSDPSVKDILERKRKDMFLLPFEDYPRLVFHFDAQQVVVENVIYPDELQSRVRQKAESALGVLMDVVKISCPEPECHLTQPIATDIPPF